MKNRILTFLNLILTSLISILGFNSSCIPTMEYAPEETDYKEKLVQGRVCNEKGEAVSNIRVVFRATYDEKELDKLFSDEVLNSAENLLPDNKYTEGRTSETGHYSMRIYNSQKPKYFKLDFIDDDGEENGGEYERRAFDTYSYGMQTLQHGRIADVNVELKEKEKQ